MTFKVDVGMASARGPRPRNDDFVAVRRAQPDESRRRLIAALADGVTFGGGGLEAAQTTVLSLIADFFAAPETWHTTVVLDRVIGAQNSWLASRNRRGPHGAAMTTLTALVLHGHGWTLAHVGDSRAWLLRSGDDIDAIEQLSTDHGFDHADLAGQLTRAIGLDDHVVVDYSQGDLQSGDIFVLTSDGVHNALSRRELARLAREGADAQSASATIVLAALDAGSQDNASALVLRVHGLDAAQLDDAMRHARDLPVPAKLKVGDRLDGFTVTALVADNGIHRLLQARDAATRQLVAIKTLSAGRAQDPEERAMLAHEAWLASRVGAGDGSGFVGVREVAAPSAFYIAYHWIAGSTLEQLLSSGRRFSAADVVHAAIEVVRALGRLHRQGVIHRDIKPANLHLGDDGVWRIIDLGVALSGREPPAARELHAGTPSYINPEQWSGDSADAASDLFALGVTLYRWLGGALPYGEVVPYQHGRYRRDPVALSRRRPEVPMWLDHLVLRAVARDPKQRFETAEEMLLALERGASRPLAPPGATPLVTRDPAALWKIGLFISLLLNALLVVWLLFLPR